MSELQEVHSFYVLFLELYFSILYLMPESNLMFGRQKSFIFVILQYSNHSIKQLR